MSRARAAGRYVGGVIAMTVASVAVGGWLTGTLSGVEAVSIVAGYFVFMFVLAAVAGIAVGAMHGR